MKMKSKILLIAMIPLLLLGAITILVSGQGTTKVVTDNIENGLRAAAVSVRDTLTYMNQEPYRVGADGELYKGETNLTEHAELADHLKEESNMDVTVFYGDTRYMTSVLDEQGSRVIGTKAGSKVTQEVLKQGAEYFSTDVDVAGQKYFGYYVPLYEAQTQQVVGMVFAGMPQKEAHDQMQAILFLMAAITLFVTVVGLIVIFIVVDRMVKSLRKGNSALAELSEGRLNTVSLKGQMLERRDEIGQISRAIHKLQRELSAVISTIVKNSDEILKTSDQLHERAKITNEHVAQMENAVGDIAVSAGNQADETQNATDHIVAMGDMIEEIAADIADLTGNARSVKERGETAIMALKELQETNGKTRQSIDVIYQQTNETNESAQEIKAATALITNIAEETNLLSLNASIEAARAGEQGRGFAVVAAQIQKLAEQSSESAKQIEAIILSLIKDSDQAVMTMNEVKRIMEQQSKNVSNTDTQVIQLLQDVDLALTAIESVSTKTDRVNQERNNVVQIVQNLSGIAQQNAASTEETSASVTEISGIVVEIAENAKELEGVSNQMEQTMARFQMEG